MPLVRRCFALVAQGGRALLLEAVGQLDQRIDPTQQADAREELCSTKPHYKSLHGGLGSKVSRSITSSSCGGGGCGPPCMSGVPGISSASEIRTRSGGHGA